MFAPDDLIAALSDGGVEYMLIGGLAVVRTAFPAQPRTSTSSPRPMGETSTAWRTCCA
jgi:hypothetical protein